MWNYVVQTRQPILNPDNILKNIRLKNLTRLIFAHLSNLIRNKCDSLVTIVNKNIDVFLISEKKIDSSFPTAQFHIKGYAKPYRLDRDMHGGGSIHYLRENILSALLNSNVSIEGFFVELNLRKKTWLLCFCSYNLHKNQISNHLEKLEET